MAQIQISPEQIPQALAQHKAEAEAVKIVLADKRKAVELLDQMEGHIASGDLSSALVCFVEIQKMEYTMQVKAFEQKLQSHEGAIDQLSHMVLGATSLPTNLPIIKVPRQ